MKTPTRLVLTIIASTLLSFAAHATPAVTLTAAKLYDVGGWFSLPNSTYNQQALFRLYAIAGSDRNGPILNPSGGLNIPLDYGTNTYVLLGDSVSGSYIGDPSPRTLELVINGPTNYQFADQMGTTSITAYSDGRLGNTFTTADGLTNVSLTQFTYVEPTGFDRVSVNSVNPDGYSDSYATITISVQPNIAGYQALIAQLNQQLADDDALIASLQTQLAAVNAQVTSLQSQLNSAQTANSNLQTQLNTANATITNLNSQLAAATATNTTLQTQLAAANTKIADLSAQLSAANVANTALQSQLAAANTQIAALQASLNTANTQIAQLQTSLATANATIQDLTAQLAAANAKIDSLTSSLNAANATIATQQATITSLQGTIGQMSSSETNLATSLGTIFNDPSFTLPGATPAEQLTNLVNAIGQLNHGQQQALYKNLGGSKK